MGGNDNCLSRDGKPKLVPIVTVSDGLLLVLDELHTL